MKMVLGKDLIEKTIVQYDEDTLLALVMGMSYLEFVVAPVYGNFGTVLASFEKNIEYKVFQTKSEIEGFIALKNLAK